MFEFFLGLVFLGIFAGLLSGFFGIGSGVILVPAYVFLFNLLDVPQEVIPLLATGTSMTTMAITIPMAAIVHYKNSNVELDIVKKNVLGSFCDDFFWEIYCAFLRKLNFANNNCYFLNSSGLSNFFRFYAQIKKYI